MLIIVERVAILKSAEIFANVPDYILASVASLVQEVEVAAGETFIHKGDVDSLMYIVVQGEIEVHDEDRSITLLGSGQIVGEMQALDPAPRSASVTAKTDTFLLSIEKSTLDDIMFDQPEIVQNIIRVLTRRLRATTKLGV